MHTNDCAGFRQNKHRPNNTYKKKEKKKKENRMNSDRINTSKTFDIC